TDPRDVRARQIRDSASQPPRQQDLGGQAHTQRRHESRIAAENVVAGLADYQHKSDQEDDEVLRIDRRPHPLTPSPFRRGGTKCRSLCRSRRHRGSVTTCSWSIARPFSTCVSPDGPRIVTPPNPSSPKPQCT